MDIESDRHPPVVTMGLNLRGASLSAIFVLVVASIPCDARIFHATVDRTTSMEQVVLFSSGPIISSDDI